MFNWRKKKKKKDQHSKGIALIIVILALSIMLLMALVVSNTATTEVAISGSSGQEATAHYLAESGLNQALAMVRSIQNGDLNDLLAGPDGQCAAPCTANGSSWATVPSTTHPLASHGNELVIDTSAPVGTPANQMWSSTATGNLLIHSLQAAPMFSPGVRGFMPANPNQSIENGGDGRPPMFATCGGSAGGAWQNCPSPVGSYPALNWAGKLEYTDPVTFTKYVTLVEVYDDDDPLSLEYNAFQGTGATYPGGFVSSTNTPNAGVYTGSPANPNTDSNCGLAGQSPAECPGGNPGRSFSSNNMDFNNRIMIRATGRVLKRYETGINSVRWRVMSESSVDAIVGFLPYPAVLTGNCLALQGSASVVGAYGSIFSNANICVTGGGVDVSQVAGAAGTICGNTNASSQVAGQPPLFIPHFKPIPDLSASPWDDGPQAAPYARPALTLQSANNGIALQYARSNSGTQRIYPGDYWIRQIAALTSVTPTGNSTLNPNVNHHAGGYILVNAKGVAGSRRTCLDGTTGCEDTAESGILARLGISEDDLQALDARVNRSTTDAIAQGNGDGGFDANASLIIRVSLKPNEPFTGPSGTVNIDAIDRTKIFIASFASGTTLGTRNSSTAGAVPKPKAISGNVTYEFYRIIPGVTNSIGVGFGQLVPGLGETLSSHNNNAPSNQSINTGSFSYGDTAHGWRNNGGAAGSCSGAPGSGCSGGCSNCPPYTEPRCNSPYGSTWEPDANDPYIDGYAYFIDGNVYKTGTGGAGPMQATLITTGHVTLRGNNRFSPVTKAKLNPLQPPFTNPIVQFLAGSDLDFGGNVADGVQFDGLAYAREQIAGTGSGTYNGQMVAADRGSRDNIVQNNSLAGNYTVTFDRAANVLGTLNVTSWRKLKF